MHIELYVLVSAVHFVNYSEIRKKQNNENMGVKKTKLYQYRTSNVF